MVLWLQCRKRSVPSVENISDQNILHIGDIYRECIILNQIILHMQAAFFQINKTR